MKGQVAFACYNQVLAARRFMRNGVQRNEKIYLDLNKLAEIVGLTHLERQL